MINSNDLKPTELSVHKTNDSGARLGEAKASKHQQNPWEAIVVITWMSGTGTGGREILSNIITELLCNALPWPLRTTKANHNVLKSTSMLSGTDQELHGLCRAVSSLKNIKRCMVSVIEMKAKMRLSKVSHSTTNHIKRPISGKLLREKRANQQRVFGSTCDA